MKKKKEKREKKRKRKKEKERKENSGWRKAQVCKGKKSPVGSFIMKYSQITYEAIFKD